MNFYMIFMFLVNVKFSYTVHYTPIQFVHAVFYILYLYRPTLNLNTLIVSRVSINFYKPSIQVLLVTDFIFVV